MPAAIWNKPPKICLACGEEFIPYRKTQMYCPKPKRCVNSVAAQKVSASKNKATSITCECGTEFTPWRPDQKRCGKLCPGRPLDERKCSNPFCKKPYIPAKRQAETWQKYCSKPCRHRSEVVAGHGLTLDQYKELLDSQGGVCAICGTHEPGKGAGRGELHIDHDHSCCPGQRSCGKCIRGLVCFHCNGMMGLAKDDPNLLIQAGSYLLRYQTEQAKRLKEKPVFVAK